MKNDTKLLRGIVDADLYSEDEVIEMSLRTPEELVENADKALEQFSTKIRSRESFILTAVAYALCCIDEQERRSRKKKRSPKKT